MGTSVGLGRRARLGLLGVLLSTVAVVGVACSSDDEADDTAADATAAGSSTGTASSETAAGGKIAARPAKDGPAA